MFMHSDCVFLVHILICVVLCSAMLLALTFFDDPGRQLMPLFALPARGFVNSLAVASSGRFVLAGMGQEPRQGRWGRDVQARNGLLMHRLTLED